MPTPVKYPWAQLAVGDIATVRNVPSSAAIRSSLAAFRERCLALGYTRTSMPRFRVSYDPAEGTARITRLHDGPVRVGRQSAEDAALTPAMLERQAIVALYEQRLAEVIERQSAGQPRGMTDLALVERARRCDPVLAQRFADLDAGMVTDLDALECAIDGRRRRAGDDTDLPVPARLSDLPADNALVGRLSRCCSSHV